MDKRLLEEAGFVGGRRHGVFGREMYPFRFAGLTGEWGYVLSGFKEVVKGGLREIGAGFGVEAV